MSNYPKSGYGGTHHGSFSGYGGDHSGYGGGHYGSYSSFGDCCPLVVDPLTYFALLGFLGAAIYFFQVLIEMSMLMMRRKRRRKRELGFQTFLAVDTLDNWLEGKSAHKSQRF